MQNTYVGLPKNFGARMPNPTIAQAQAVTRVIAEHNVAMKNQLAEFNELEKPIRAQFEADRKPIYDAYRLSCKELTEQKDACLDALALEANQND